jgi:4-aminobutyrate aminotransferase-like enzyme
MPAPISTTFWRAEILMDMKIVNAFDPGAAAGMPPRERALLHRREKVLGSGYRLFYGRPVHLVRGEGVWLYDPDGNAYLDAYNNVACVGHSNEHVVSAMSEQAARLNTHTRYLTDGILDYAERLLAYFPQPLSQVMFTCTGSEANDLAYRMAREFTQGDGFIVTENAYHGVTSAVSGMSPSLGNGVAPFVRTVPAPNSYRSPGVDVAEVFAASVRAAVRDLRAQGIRPAALLLDTIFSSDGILPDPPGMLRAAVEAIHAVGGLFIADEVQAGFGRLGAGMWGFGRHDVIPDIVTLGKPMGNGFPLAGVVARPDVAAGFGARTRYFNTFGGNSVACAVGMAVLDVIEDLGLVDHAAAVGSHLVDGLRQLADRHEVIGDVRGSGLFIGVELVSDRATRAPAPDVTQTIVDGLRDRRVLVSSSGASGNTLKIRPPLVFTSGHADQLLGTLDQVLATIGSPAG